MAGEGPPARPDRGRESPKRKQEQSPPTSHDRKELCWRLTSGLGLSLTLRAASGISLMCSNSSACPEDIFQSQLMKQEPHDLLGACRRPNPRPALDAAMSTSLHFEGPWRRASKAGRCT